MRVTTDVDNTSGSAPTLYLKYAFFQYRDVFFDFLGVNLQGGLVSTPMLGLIYDISDTRWIYQSLLDKSANMLNGFSMESSADYGVRLSFIFADMITLTGAVVNGEGFKKNAGGLSDYDGLAYYGMIVINPVPELFLVGSTRWEEYRAKQDNFGSDISDKGYCGFGVAVKTALIRVGAFYWMFWDNDRQSSLFGTRPPTVRKSYSLFEWYLMMNMGAVVPTLPVLLHGRLSQGYENAGQAANSDVRRRTRMFAAGIGWAFNAHLRILAYYERYMYDVGRRAYGYRNPHPASNFMVKGEVAF